MQMSPKVASIHAYQPPIKGPVPETFFLPGADCWGWATWSRAWHGAADGAKLLESLRRHPQRGRFDYIGTYPNTKMLKDYIGGRNNSWAIRWHASTFTAGMFTLHPGKTLVRNIGLDGSGTHCTDDDDLNSALADTPVRVRCAPVVDAVAVWKVSPLLRRAVRSKGVPAGAAVARWQEMTKHA